MAPNAGMSRLDQRARRAADNPQAVLARAAPPARAGLDHAIRMVLRDVVQVVSHRTTNVFTIIVSEVLDQCEHGCGVAHKYGQAFRPRKTRTRAFGNQSPNVFVRVACPDSERLDGQLRMQLQEGADRELRSEQRRQLTQCIERSLGVAETIGADDRSSARRRNPAGDHRTNRDPIFARHATRHRVPAGSLAAGVWQATR